MANEGWMTAAEIAKEIGTSEYSVSRAILALGITDAGRKDMADRRRIIYPPDSLLKVRKWLETN